MSGPLLDSRQTRVVVDSSSNVPVALQVRHRMLEVPTLVNFGAESFRNNVDLTAEQFYNRIAENSQWPTTSQPPPAFFADAYRQAFAEGATHLVVCTASAKFSGTFRAAQSAAAEFGLDRFTLWDSDSASMGSGWQALLAARWLEVGISREQLVERLDKVRAATRGYATIESLKYAARSGRLSNFQAGVGDLLQVKAILEVTHGRFSAIGRVRGRSRSLREMIDRFIADMDQRPVNIAIGHGNAPEEAARVAEDAQARLNVRELYIVEIGPAIASLAGPGIIGILGHPADVVEKQGESG
ncbi:MAG TPA: DegV family protein [Caldilineaceae bacterium]|nr:DegV family protein [Caldilineaceae bacterium]